MTESQFLDGVPEKDGVTFFRGKVVVYYINDKLKSEIFNKKKVYKQNVIHCFKLGNFN